jgi:Raf kinase inhibitor-like YbhB/YbcL family protein
VPDVASRPSPYDWLPQLPTLDLRSNDVADGSRFTLAQVSGLFGVEGGQDRSPQLSWSGAPAGTQSYAVTMYDPDAPTASGFWHWAVFDVPADVTELATDAGNGSDGALPAGAKTLRNDGGVARFIGAAPPEGHGDHRYYIAVHAVSVPELDVGLDASPALLGFTLFMTATARGVIRALYSR